MACTSEPDLSEGLTDSSTALGIYQLYTVYTWLATITRLYSKLQYSNLKHKKQIRVRNDPWLQKTEASGKSSFRLADANKIVCTNLMDVCSSLMNLPLSWEREIRIALAILDDEFIRFL